MNEIRMGAAAVFCDDKLFVFGGEKSVPNHKISYSYPANFCNNYEIYSGTWQLKSSKELYQRSCFAAQVVGSKVYLIGGCKYEKALWCNECEKQVSEETHIFCPSKNRWRNAGSLNTARASFSSAVLNSKIYVFGGIGAGNSYVSSVEVFDVRQKRWTSGGTIQQAASPTSACSVSDTIYFLANYNEKLYKYRQSEYAGDDTSNLEVDRNAPGGGVLLPFSHRYLSYHLFQFCRSYT